MRQHIARGFGRIVAAAVVAVVTIPICAARAPLPVDTGTPSDLINTPACAGSFEHAHDCARIGWPEGRARPFHRSI